MYFMNKPVHIYERTIMKVPILFVLLMSLNDFDGTYWVWIWKCACVWVCIYDLNKLQFWVTSSWGLVFSVFSPSIMKTLPTSESRLLIYVRVLNIESGQSAGSKEVSRRCVGSRQDIGVIPSLVRRAPASPPFRWPPQRRWPVDPPLAGSPWSSPPGSTSHPASCHPKRWTRSMALPRTIRTTMAIRRGDPAWLSTSASSPSPSSLCCRNTWPQPPYSGIMLHRHRNRSRNHIICHLAMVSWPDWIACGWPARRSNSHFWIPEEEYRQLPWPGHLLHRLQLLRDREAREPAQRSARTLDGHSSAWFHRARLRRRKTNSISWARWIILGKREIN